MQNSTIFIDNGLEYCAEMMYEANCTLMQNEIVNNIDGNLLDENIIKSDSDHLNYLPDISVYKKEFETEEKDGHNLFMECTVHEDVIVEEVAEQEVISDTLGWLNGISSSRNSEEIQESSVQNIADTSSISNHYQCSFCSNYFLERSLFIDHLFLSHSKENIYQCYKCNDTFRRKKALINHMRSHDKSRQLSHKMLLKAEFYSNVSNIKMKENIYNFGIKKTKRLKKSKIEKTRIDELCDYYTENISKMELHRKQHKKSNFQCSCCNQIFFNNATFVEHMRTEHATFKDGYICGYCEKRCKDYRGLQKHCSMHFNGERFSCNTCNKQFYTRTRLKRHTLSHRNKEVICDECGEKMGDYRALANHRSSHHVVVSRNGALTTRTFPCCSCNKIFGSKSSQQIHMRIHTGERPYSCKYCVKAFADGGTLRKHERIHTGEKPYVCPICRKAFNQRVVLREHIRAHHAGSNEISKKFLECEICHEICYSSQELCSHLVKHSDENTAKHRLPVKRPRKYKKWPTKEYELKKKKFFENKSESNDKDDVNITKRNGKNDSTYHILIDENDLEDVNHENELIPCSVEQYDKNNISELQGITIYIENNDNFLSFTDDAEIPKWKIENNESNNGINMNYHLLSPFSDKLPEECITITEACEEDTNVETCLNLISISDHKMSDNYFNTNVADCNDKSGMWFALKEKYEFAFDSDFCVYSGLGLGATVELQSEF